MSARARESLIEVVDAVRRLGEGRYACVLDAGGVVVEAPLPDDGHLVALRRLLEESRGALLTISRLAAGESAEDPFGEWHHDEFLVAVVNERAALVVVCPDSEALKEGSDELLRVWVDRVFRFDERYRFDPRGRGLFLGRPRLDIVAVGKARDG